MVLSSQDHVCVHGHFYQPPRTNPFTGSIDEGSAAAPYSNWNERITAECYAPNTQARLLDRDGLLLKRINNFEWISFNFGATALAWLEVNAPDTYRSIIDADEFSAEHFGGHGSAVAQGYSHTILPLSNDRDLRTQVRWGIADFEHRFGRAPEGFWLPETAVDMRSLRVLAEEGVRYTILSPYQAESVRIPSGDWIDVTGGRIDSRVPYFIRIDDGLSIAVFFYNGALSTEIAFNGLLNDGRMLAKRLVHELDDNAHTVRLSHVATDGESYGHHHRFGEMALSAAIEAIRRDPEVALTNYGQFLELSPPLTEARIIEDSAWSCAHGVERWRSDCGCAPQDHPEWTQGWRTPLREALDWLRDNVGSDFEGAGVFADPWAARDAYIEVILGGDAHEFIDRHATDGNRQLALSLLEIQHHAQLMYASCAWFFDDIDRLEGLIALRQAAKVIQMSRQVLGKDYQAGFVEKLSAIESNKGGTAHDIWEREVAPLLTSV